MMQSILWRFGLCVVAPVSAFQIPAPKIVRVAVDIDAAHPGYVGAHSHLLNSNAERQKFASWSRLYASTSDNAAVSSSGIGSDELEIIFAEYADGGNTISKNSLKQVDLIQELLEDGDLLAAEVDEIWNKYAEEKQSESVNLQAFGKIYREIEDMFEEEEEEEDVADSSEPTMTETETEPSLLMDDVEAKAELERVFAVLTKDSDGLLSKSALRAWDEIETLMVDGMLEDDEFDELWEATPKAASSADSLDLNGFLIFDTNLDELFDFDDELNEEEEEEDDNDDEAPEETSESTETVENMVDEAQDEPADSESEEAEGTLLFESLAGESGRVSFKDLSNWDELAEMLEDGDILQEEVQEIFALSLEKSKDGAGLDETAFEVFQTAIDDLFEDDDDDDAVAEVQPATENAQPVQSSKGDLLRAIAVMANNDIEEERLPCGLESTEREDKLVLSLANQLMQDESNLLLQRNIETIDVAGTWELLYTSSSAMKFNKGLSGIAGSFPNGRFGGLKQILSGSALLPDVEYKERIEVNPSSASFDVTVNGNWELRQSTSLFTGAKSILMAIEPDRVMYGPTSTKADHWKSLGPTNMLDVVYLDDDLRIMRGSTSVDTILIFQRI